MHWWEITIKLRSGLGTPLANHTIWGHLCWGIRYHEGEDALNTFLAQCNAGNPPIILSDAMPVKRVETDTFFVPRPNLPAPLRPLEDPGNERADTQKKCKKTQWVTESSWNEISASLSIESLDSILNHVAPPSLQKATVMHASINRMTGTTQGEDKTGALFDQEQWYADEKQNKFRIIAFSDEDTNQARVSQLIEWAFEGGYGRDASSGLGTFDVVSITPHEKPHVENSNCVMLLGSAVPSSKDPVQGFFSWGLHAGRVGGTFANSELPNGSKQRAKRPVHILQRGTILKTDKPTDWIGRCVSGVHEYEPIRHGGFAPCLPCKLNDETMRLVEGTA